MDKFNTNEIMEMLPHRYPFLLIDQVVEFIPNKHVTAIKNITINEPFFVGHFPEKPIMPGVLTIEAMAQACAVCAVASLGNEFKGKPVYFAGINEARFRKPVFPGDVLKIEAEVIRTRSFFWIFKCKTLNQEQQVATEAEIKATIENS